MPTIEVSDETFATLQEQFGDEISPVELNSLENLIGQKWFFRTVTNYMLGRVKKQVGKFLVLEQASWVADTKRFHNYLKGDTKNAEIEPVGECLLNIDSIVDAFPWKHKLLTKQQ